MTAAMLQSIRESNLRLTFLVFTDKSTEDLTLALANNIQD